MGRIICENTLCRYNYEGMCSKYADVQLTVDRLCDVWDRESALKCPSTSCTHYDAYKQACGLKNNHIDDAGLCADYAIVG